MRNTIIPAAHLLLLQEEKILLTKRFNTGYHDGDWGVISGHIEKGEFPLSAMIREAHEESGIDINPEDLTYAHVMHRINRTSGNERVDYFFSCRKWKNQPIVMETDKCDAMKWVSRDSLPENTIPYIRQMLENMSSGVFYSEREE